MKLVAGVVAAVALLIGGAAMWGGETAEAFRSERGECVPWQSDYNPPGLIYGCAGGVTYSNFESMCARYGGTFSMDGTTKVCTKVPDRTGQPMWFELGPSDPSPPPPPPPACTWWKVLLGWCP